MSDKHYIPSIEEFHVGFEYETHEISRDESGSKEGNYDRWEPRIADKKKLEFIWKYGVKGIRVKYLDSEDIESLGFVFTGESIDKWFKLEGSFDIGSWTSYKIVLHFNESDNSVFIYADDRGSEEVLFNGILKNKSELARLLKQLNITK